MSPPHPAALPIPLDRLAEGLRNDAARGKGTVTWVIRLPEVTLVFPAHSDSAPSITAVDEEATLVMRLGAHPITARCKLRDMMVRG